jgi:hypothetical protein
MTCYKKNKHACGTKNYATCIEYQGTLPEFSVLEDCVDLEETTEELYTLIGEIKEEIYVTAVTSCETLPVEKTVKTLIQFLLDRDCAQQEQIDSLLETIATMQEQITDLQEGTCP